MFWLVCLSISVLFGLKVFDFLFAAELMVLGFISLLLTFGSSFILEICIPSHVAHTMLPCPTTIEKEVDEKGEEGHRKLLWFDHRVLSEISVPKCKKEVRVMFQIFFLAVPKIVKIKTIRVVLMMISGLWTSFL